MTLQHRGFFAGILAAASAPAIVIHNGIGPQWGGRYTPNFVKPEIAFDLSDTVPADGKWDYVSVGPNGMSLEKW